jgi:hypothetical protein
MGGENMCFSVGRLLCCVDARLSMVMGGEAGGYQWGGCGHVVLHGGGASVGCTVRMGFV